MSEYRRFIAYFYEYIDGRKRKNVGFAKVELRSGMWRILFRLHPEQAPEPPVEVFGFVRKERQLLGLRMGTIQTDGELKEEWAYQAAVPISKTYYMEDLAGIWIRSADDRNFLTVWDEEDIEVGTFVTETEQPESEQPESEQSESERPESEQPESEQPVSDRLVSEPAVLTVQECGIRTKDTENPCGDLEYLMRRRTVVDPFAENETMHCVMLRPCDITWLQQRGWKAGRSSFLLHGFHQYHHLLLACVRNETYLLGVPGVNTSQEQYMAQLFGYQQFLPSPGINGKNFGYWCRSLMFP